MTNALIRFVRSYTRELTERQHPAAPLIPVHHQGRVHAVPTALETTSEANFHLRGRQHPARHELALIALCEDMTKMPQARALARTCRRDPGGDDPIMATAPNMARTLHRLTAITGPNIPLQISIGQTLLYCELKDTAHVLAQAILTEYHRMMAPPTRHRP